MLSVREEGVKGEKRIYARKLVVATGMTSEPVKPVIEGEEQFGAPVFHCKDFGKHADTLCSAKRVAVLGGTKSAWDVAYSYASSGVEVDWIIRGGFVGCSPVEVCEMALTRTLSRERTRTGMDGASVCHAVQEMAGETRP